MKLGTRRYCPLLLVLVQSHATARLEDFVWIYMFVCCFFFLRIHEFMLLVTHLKCETHFFFSKKDGSKKNELLRS